MTDHTFTEAAKLLRVSRGWLYDMAAQGQIPHLRYGRPGSQRPRLVLTDEHLTEIRRRFEQPAVSGRQLRRVS